MTVELQERLRDGCWGFKLEYIKQWPNVPESLIPQRKDAVKVHFGDFGEEVVEYVVLYRIIDGDNMDKIIVVMEKIER